MLHTGTYTDYPKVITAALYNNSMTDALPTYLRERVPTANIFLLIQDRLRPPVLTSARLSTRTMATNENTETQTRDIRGGDSEGCLEACCASWVLFLRCFLCCGCHMDDD